MEKCQVCSCGKTASGTLDQLKDAFLAHRVLFAPLLIDPEQSTEILSAVDERHRWIGLGKMPSMVEQRLIGSLISEVP